MRLFEPHGVGNPEPVFAARGVQLSAPPRILKDKHVKLKLRAGESSSASSAPDSEELTAAAILATPRCHPDSAAIRRSEREAAVAPLSSRFLRPGGKSARQGGSNGISPGTENRELRTKLKITFDALGWHMAERLAQTPLLADDTIDIAFTVSHNDHPDYGGLELSLRDFKVPTHAE